MASERGDVIEGNFSEFAESRLATRLHETLIARTMDGHLIDHILRDATAIEASGEAGADSRRQRSRCGASGGGHARDEAWAKEPISG